MLRFLKILVFAVLLFLSLLFVLIRYTLPDYEGKILTNKVSSRVTIYRDSWGMPVIEAQNEKDLAFGTGYAMAQDRLFQMDLIRRAVQGRLSEIFGEDLLRVDKFFLTITAGRSVKEILANHPPEIRELLESFSEGVNHFIKQNRLPVEFHLLGYKPEPWSPADSVSVLYYMSFDLNSAYDTEILFYLLTRKFGIERANELFPDYVPGKSEILEVANYAKTRNQTLLTFLETLDSVKTFFSSEYSGASNNWVLAPEKTEDGVPVVASDMHLGFSLPGIWYEAQLVTPEMNVSGVLLPGIPFVIVGMNEHVGWAFTNVMADDADFYIEKINPANPDQYLFRGEYRDFITEKKVFVIKKTGKEETFLLQRTHRGPVISNIHPLKTEEVISMRWTPYDHHLAAVAIYLANKSRSIDDIEKAVEYFKAPGQNWVYADKEGNIGFTAAVAIPVRQGYNGMLPMPGWTGQYEWNGYVPGNQQPRLRNPASRWIATANNKHSTRYPYVISNYYHLPDRYERIKEFLTSREKFNVEDMKNLQTDVKMLFAGEILPVILKDLEEFSMPDENHYREAIAYLKNWNKEVTADSVEAAIFHTFIWKILVNTFQPHLGDLWKYYQKKEYIPLNALRIQFQNPDSFWFDDPRTPEKEKRKDVVFRSFLDTIKLLKEEISPDVENWKWGKIHRLEFKHPFGRNKYLARIFNRGPFEVSGSFATVNPMNFNFDSFPFSVRSGASERLIMRIGKKDSSLRILPTGVSGNPFSSFYANQMEYFLGNRYREFSLFRPGDERFSYRYKLEILPE